MPVQRHLLYQVSALAGSYRTLDTTGKQLDATLVEARATMIEARATLVTANRAIGLLQTRSDTTLAAVTQLANNGNEAIGALRPELRSVLASARDTSDLARQTLQQVSDLTASGAAPREDLEASLRDLSQAARGLREYIELLEEQPNAVIFGHRRP